MRLEGYSLLLYCDNLKCPRGGREGPRLELTPFNGNYTKESCERQAKSLGWTLGDRDLCPACKGHKFPRPVDDNGNPVCERCIEPLINGKCVNVACESS